MLDNWYVSYLLLDKGPSNPTLKKEIVCWMPLKEQRLFSIVKTTSSKPTLKRKNNGKSYCKQHR